MRKGERSPSPLCLSRSPPSPHASALFASPPASTDPRPSKAPQKLHLCVVALDVLPQLPPSPVPLQALAAPSSAQPASPFSTSLSSEPGSSQGQSLLPMPSPLPTPALPNLSLSLRTSGNPPHWTGPSPSPSPPLPAPPPATLAQPHLWLSGTPGTSRRLIKTPVSGRGPGHQGHPPPPRPGHTLGRARPSPRAHRREGGWGLWADQDSVLPHATPTAPFPGPHVGAPGPRGLRPSLTGGAACLQSACHATSSPGARHRPTCHRLCPRAALGRQAAGRGHWSWSAQ